MVVQFQPYTAYDIRVMRDALAIWCTSRNIVSDSDAGKDVALRILHMMAAKRYTQQQLLEQLETLWPKLR